MRHRAYDTGARGLFAVPRAHAATRRGIERSALPVGDDAQDDAAIAAAPGVERCSELVLAQLLRCLDYHDHGVRARAVDDPSQLVALADQRLGGESTDITTSPAFGVSSLPAAPGGNETIATSPLATLVGGSRRSCRSTAPPRATSTTSLGCLAIRGR
jgi:hypothetical protein